MSNDAFGRQILQNVWADVLGEVAQLVEIQVVQAVSRGEGGYGLATYRRLSIPDGAVIGTVSDSNNWGAIQCGHGPPCGGDCFTATDSSPNKQTADNPKGLYETCFRRWPSPEEGCASYLRTLLVKRPGVRDAVRTGSAQLVAEEMHASKYFEGFGRTVEERIGHYADAIVKNAAAVAQNLGEPLLVTRELPSGGGPGGDDGGGFGLGGIAACLVGAYALWRWT